MLIHHKGNMYYSLWTPLEFQCQLVELKTSWKHAQFYPQCVRDFPIMAFCEVAFQNSRSLRKGYIRSVVILWFPWELTTWNLGLLLRTGEKRTLRFEMSRVQTWGFVLRCRRAQAWTLLFEMQMRTDVKFDGSLAINIYMCPALKLFCFYIKKPVKSFY
jgi:hypothetical protein